jgi:UDP-N-acetylmuramoyl-L-alanyl-D-glutamate--2,6-diaminopimelate ligase
MILGKLCMETMRLESITRVIQPITVRGPISAEIEGIAFDSRHVRENGLFVALRGQRADGAAYIEEAIRRGAVAVVSENDEWTRRNVAHIRVEDSRLALAEIACAFYNQPSSKLEAYGVTGTNGKTTTTFMIRGILTAAGRSPGLIGTIRYEIGERVIPATRTTPEAPDIHYMLDQMVRHGGRSVAMEVSSHALEQKRVWGVDFDVGVFTNLTRDHLDYHGDMGCYFAAKTQLFRSLGQFEKSATAAINIDDSWGMCLASTHGLKARLVTFGTHPGAMVRAEDVEFDGLRSSFRLRSPWGDADVALEMPGRFNVSNALAALAACGSQGIDPGLMAEALRHVGAVPGRLEPVPNRRGLHVYVDYAHTDDALANVLRTLREVSRRRLLVVFGCGGDRDRSKRPQMGAVAAQLADFAVVTSDNPRSEDAGAIIREIVAGMPPQGNYEVLPDRAAAIHRALEMAREGDTVLIAGKGHETYQETANRTIPFDDREVARTFLSGVC